MLNLRLVLWMLLVVLTVCGAGAVSAQDYPSKPIRIVTTPAGTGNDSDARLIAQAISGSLGQPVIVDNRGSGIIPQEAVSKAPPDGYTLLVGGGSVWIFPLLQKAPYDVVRDFSPISVIERTVYVVTVHPSIPAKSVKELITLAKARPGELNYAATTTGSGNHLAAELFKALAGVNLARVNYKGSAAIMLAMISGEVQVTIIDAPVVAPHAKSGKLRALAVTSATPSQLAPGLPPVASELPGYEVVGLSGILAPAKTPGAIIDRLNQEIVRYLNRPEVKEKFLSTGAEVVASSPEQFVATLKSEIAKWAKVIKDAGIKAD